MGCGRDRDLGPVLSAIKSLVHARQPGCSTYACILGRDGCGSPTEVVETECLAAVVRAVDHRLEHGCLDLLHPSEDHRARADCELLA